MIVLAKVAAAVFPGTAEHGLAHGLPSSLFIFFKSVHHNTQGSLLFSFYHLFISRNGIVCQETCTFLSLSYNLSNKRRNSRLNQVHVDAELQSQAPVGKVWS